MRFLTVVLACSLTLCAQTPAGDSFDRGMALARANRWAEAEKAFAAGWKQAPRDKRFPIELAGIAFRQKRFSTARDRLREALRLDPADNYANSFLATVYFLEGNLEAALKYWNRAGKPAIREIRMDPEPRIRPALLDRAFAFSPASVLQLRDYRATESRIDRLQVFSRYRFDLDPGDDGKFDLTFRPLERGGWPHNRLLGAIAMLRGLPFQTLQPELYNLQNSARNFVSLVRWDSQKRRAFASFSAPLERDPAWQYRLFLDGRNENWEFASGGLNMERAVAGAEFDRAFGSGGEWSNGFELADRRFRNQYGQTGTTGVLTEGFSLKYRAGIAYPLVRVPERRFTLEGAGGWQLGRIFNESSDPFTKFTGGLDARWLPRASGDDYAMRAQLRGGRSAGPVPFDELFILGLERDNDLWLRGHIGTRDGRKGSAPMGRDFTLINWDLDKNVVGTALFELKLGPFVDGGRIAGQPVWLWDAGLQCKVRVLGGFEVTFTYGKDLRTGRNSFYALNSR